MQVGRRPNSAYESWKILKRHRQARLHKSLQPHLQPRCSRPIESCRGRSDPCHVYLSDSNNPPSIAAFVSPLPKTHTRPPIIWTISDPPQRSCRCKSSEKIHINPDYARERLIDFTIAVAQWVEPLGAPLAGGYPPYKPAHSAWLPP